MQLGYCVAFLFENLIVFNVVSHVQGMSEIKTDIGHARAWIR